MLLLITVPRIYLIMEKMTISLRRLISISHVWSLIHSFLYVYKVSWCRWLSHQSNTLKVSGSNPGEAKES